MGLYSRELGKFRIFENFVETRSTSSHLFPKVQFQYSIVSMVRSIESRFFKNFRGVNKNLSNDVLVCCFMDFGSEANFKKNSSYVFKIAYWVPGTVIAEFLKPFCSSKWLNILKQKLPIKVKNMKNFSFCFNWVILRKFSSINDAYRFPIVSGNYLIPVFLTLCETFTWSKGTPLIFQLIAACLRKVVLQAETFRHQNISMEKFKKVTFGDFC